MFKIFKDIKDDSYEFKPTIVEIEETPLNPIGRSILWIVIGIIVFGLLWLFFAKVDIVVSASGKYIPSGNIKILKPLESGIISQILVKEGDKVKAKEPLIVIDPSVSTVNLTTKEENLQALKYSITRLELLTNKDEFVQDANLSTDEKALYVNQKTNYDETIFQYSFKIEQLLNSIKANEEEIKKLILLKDIATKRVEKLNKVKEIIAYKEYEDAKSKELDLKSQLIVSNEKLLMEKARLNEMKTELDVFKSSSKSKWMDELLSKQKEANLVRAEINALSFQTKQQVITSPVDGYVGKLLVHTIGSSISSTEELLSIIPSDEPLIISANMLNRDVGFLKLEQNVSIKVDAFNFQKYGKIEGKLIHIANDSIKDEKLGEIYEIKIKPLKTNLMVNGELKQMEPGMSVVAEVKVGKRRVIELFIYPIIKYLDEGLSVK